MAVKFCSYAQGRLTIFVLGIYIGPLASSDAAAALRSISI